MASSTTEFPRCPECGGRVELTARAGRTRERWKGFVLEIPSDVAIPTCTVCGEESMTAEISEPLDARLAASLGLVMDGAAADRIFERYEALCADALALGTPEHVLRGWRRIRNRTLTIQIVALIVFMASSVLGTWVYRGILLVAPVALLAYAIALVLWFRASGRFLTRLRTDHLAIVQHREALRLAFEDVKAVVKGSPSVGSS